MLGERLKELRLERKLTQEQLGKGINVTKVSISGYENGNRTPDTETLQKIADYFNVSTDYLLGRSDNRSRVNSDEEFKNIINDPELERWFKELPKSDEDDLRKLKKMWEIIKNEEN
ncbi:helix-turn-helix transcriptional regulator [Bacillus aquiflavi]|uniref:Helix-turn-helix transcriptional regulator n=1 Tax=Bacillus aquiflavi TaxID=2672567 RepID=A0A6B3VUV9_9BACI|nr:helix-turn-helix transcriptional regulator [Bacillus aquiflavi]MBA4536394.1 helix-turn-helix transcriptional regulator [Bacillus aquiflavi]NEY80762.1 helix-turn-helix transcriptional regulator [Bacillus aquiflavi]UAC49145.1 helix-turn-helix domain-containing protein [Bacillus aquiflavi]